MSKRGVDVGKLVMDQAFGKWVSKQQLTGLSPEQFLRVGFAAGFRNGVGFAVRMLQTPKVKGGK